jgi:hypothetical protein
MKKVFPTVYTAEFSSCTGFGSEGRMVVFRSTDKDICSGAGGTDDEAVLEALLDLGFSYDDAFDLVGITLHNAAKIVRA